MTEPPGERPSISEVAATAKGLEIRVARGHLSPSTEILSWRWVRDHGEDPASLDHATGQRKVNAIGGAEPEPAVQAGLTGIAGRAEERLIVVDWPAGPTPTYISVATVERLLAPPTARRRLEPVLWDNPDAVTHTADALAVADVLADDGALAAWLSDLATVGFAILKGFPVGRNDSATEITKLADRIGYVRSSVFGETWELAADVAGHDTSYSEDYLAPHTDGTYCQDPPGLQMFCCLERSGTGGESIVVDGFAIAKTLRQEYPEDYRVLSTVAVPAHYIEPGVELRAARPAIVLDNSDSVQQVSLNNYDRAPMLLPPDEMATFYRAYGRLHELANDRSRWFTIGLQPGDVLINNNWRILHGRNEYTGLRRLIGCYLNREDFDSRLRTLSLVGES